jgi:hypothetical protein
MMMFEAVGLPQTLIDECVAILNKRWDEKYTQIITQPGTFSIQSTQSTNYPTKEQ